MMKKHFLAATFAVAVVSLGTFTVLPVSAATQTAQDTLISRLAEKFNLNKTDVQAVFDQFRSERQAAREVRYESYLSGLVAAGKLTNEQKSLLIAKRKELTALFQTERNTWKSLTPEQRKAQVDTKLKDLKTWADQNHIAIKYLIHNGGKPGFRMGYRLGKMN